MANKTIIATKLKLKENRLKEIKKQIAPLSKEYTDLSSVINEIEDEKEKEEMQKILNDLKVSLEEKKDEEKKVNKEIQDLKDELEDIEEAEEEKSDNKTTKGDNKMKKSTQRSIKRFVQSRGLETGTLETENKGVVIPNEAITARTQQVDKLDLTKHVRIVKTNTPSGSYGVLKKSNQKLTAVTELATKELPTPEIINMEYDIKTYRGQVPVSMEMVEDADFDVTELLTEHLNELDINTKNSEIIAKMKTAPKKAVTGLAGIKEMLNKDVSTMYNAKAYVSTSLFDELDLLKDTSGRFLLQDDITVKTGKRVNGKEVVVIPDEQIGVSSGDLVGFFGDLHEFVTLFDRKKDVVQWVDNFVHGQVLNGSVRFDTQAADTEAGFYVTYTAAV
ncbi:phage major capsid protein [Carnobacterium funditum]|uniref:phage major capsid protein n=1 Tax=Carnobacterium funditum TaxID=2752 RepID=UPI000554A8BE|nr:phage major capsid protein [Carnobacterium funditum]